MTDTATPLSRLKGTTAKSTRVDTLLMAGLTLVPASIMASMGIPYRAEKAGSR